jgi:endo-alpha-1,4-polygalactosaminidase (GH114 family)
VVDTLLDHLDGWNREDVTSTYSFEGETYEPVSTGDTAAAQATLRRLAEAGLLVTTTDYVADGDDASARRAVEAACEVGAVPFVADIGLTRLPDEPHRC